MQIANQLGSDRPVRIHRQDSPPLGPDQSSGPVKKMVSDGRELFKLPQGRPLRGSSAVFRPRRHLQLPTKIVCQNAREEKHLICDPLPSRNIAQLALRLEFGEDRLLGSPTVVKGRDAMSLGALVSNDHFEFVAIGMGHEEVQLDRAALTDGGARTYDQEAAGLTPAFWFPRQLKIGDVRVEAMPLTAILDQLFEIDETMKRHGDTELRPQIIEQLHHFLAEEGAVDSHFNAGIRQDTADLSNTGSQEVSGTVRVMDISGAMEDIENLARLSDGTEKGVVAALPFLFRIESDCSAFCPATRAYNRTVEVERHTRQVQLGQAIQDQLSDQPAEPLNTRTIESCQHPAHGSHIGQSLEPENSLDHRVVSVEASISKVAVSEQEMHDQTQDEGGIGVGAAGLKVPKATAQPRSQIELGDQGLKKDQSREGSQLLFLEAQFWHAMGFELNVFSAKIHRGGLLGLVVFLVEPIITRVRSLFYKNLLFLDLTSGELQGLEGSGFK